MPRFLKLITIILTILLLPLLSDAQSKKRLNELEDKSEMREREARQAEAELIAKHQANQSKEVRKRMKATKKRAQRLNNNKGPAKPFFVVRWFTK